MQLFSKYFLILFLGISLQSCSQNKNQIMQNPNITADNIVENIVKEVKHYPQESIYGMHHEVEKCYFEISVNDMPAFRNFDFNVPDAFEINNTVYLKGKYTVNYKLYPVGKNENYLETYNNLVDDTQLKLSLYSYDKNNKGAVVSTPSANPLTTVIWLSTKKLLINRVLLTPISETFLDPTTDTLLPNSNREKSPLKNNSLGLFFFSISVSLL